MQKNKKRNLNLNGMVFSVLLISLVFFGLVNAWEVSHSENEIQLPSVEGILVNNGGDWSTVSSVPSCSGAGKVLGYYNGEFKCDLPKESCIGYFAGEGWGPWVGALAGRTVTPQTSCPETIQQCSNTNCVAYRNYCAGGYVVQKQLGIWINIVPEYTCQCYAIDCMGEVFERWNQKWLK